MRVVGVSFAVAIAMLASAPDARATACADLQSAINAAPSGGTVTVDAGSTCTLTTTLTWGSKELTLQGGGAGATLVAPANASAVAFFDAASSTVRNLTIRDASPPASAPGAISVTGTSAPTFDQLRFFNNETPVGGTSRGGAISVESTATSGAIRVLGSTFGDGTVAERNSASRGGAIWVQGNVPVEIRGSTFRGNHAESQGGAVLIEADNATLAQNVFAGNDVGPSFTLYGGAVLLQDFDPDPIDYVLTGNVFSGNVLTGNGSTFFARGAGVAVNRANSQASPVTSTGNTYDGNQVTNFTGSIAGGAGMDVVGASLTSRSDRFTNNSLPASSAPSEGAGLSIVGCGNPTPAPSRIENAIVAGNDAAGSSEGAGVYIGCADGPVALTVLNTTISGNSAAGDTAGIWGGSDDRLTMVNSVAAGNTGALDIAGFDAQRAITYSDACVASAAAAGTGNICADPKLAAPATGDVRQLTGSPLIDAGDTAAVPADLTLDAFGDPRITDGDGNGVAVVDMGADESPGGPGKGPDSDPPGLDLSAKKSQVAGKPVKVKALADEACTLELTGAVKPKGEAKGKLKTKTDPLEAGKPETLKLKLPKKLAQALEESEKGKAKIAGTCTDAAGNSDDDKAKVKLK